eukprot:Gregarina_sp_Poly_1__412@NODE_10_length_23460_cov_121_463087_g8_i1_p10_GENE_NODE_10_length_23460_cov_121_463087_g8_i1NODE_10_length_23460_cov_121_463087_g8_i1_p10_ORF_typecomplete_len233_score23_38_NODE_10_length_23460_cov_121_463087_g8_i146905388
MKFLTSFFTALFVCAPGTLGDVNVLFGALAYANLPLELQSMARLISDDITRNLNAFSANRVADILKNADVLAIMGSQRAKTENMNLAEDWDRLLWGLLEVLKLESKASCRDIRIEPALCEEVTTVGEMYIRHKLCDEMRDPDWRRRVCPDQPNTRDSRDAVSPRSTYRFRTPPPVERSPVILTPTPVDRPSLLLPTNSVRLSLQLPDGGKESTVADSTDQPLLKEFDASIFD